MKITLVLTLLMISTPSYSFNIREYLPEFINELIDMGTGIELPEIPEITENSKSIVKEIEDVEIKDKKLKKKLDNYFLLELFEQVKLREATENELKQWFNVLSNGGSREGVYRGLTLDAEYEHRTYQEEYRKKEAVEPILKIFKKYVNKQYDFSREEFSNIFLLKRLFVEKSLEVIDLLEDRKDISKWFAIFSVESSSFFSKGLRSSKDPWDHYQWANSVPLDFLKGEFAIRAHAYFNSFLR